MKWLAVGHEFGDPPVRVGGVLRIRSAAENEMGPDCKLKLVFEHVTLGLCGDTVQEGQTVFHMRNGLRSGPAGSCKFSGFEPPVDGLSMQLRFREMMGDKFRLSFRHGWKLVCKSLAL